jgi:hypothetical protein
VYFGVDQPQRTKGAQKGAHTSALMVEAGGRRRISRREARELALRFMAQMESVRLKAAEDEARRAFPLEGIW